MTDITVDELAIDRFSVHMKLRMANARSKGRDGWDDPEKCSSERLAKMLVNNVANGDYVDVANYAMMLHEREESPEVLMKAFIEMLAG